MTIRTRASGTPLWDSVSRINKKPVQYDTTNEGGRSPPSATRARRAQEVWMGYRVDSWYQCMHALHQHWIRRRGSALEISLLWVEPKMTLYRRCVAGLFVPVVYFPSIPKIESASPGPSGSSAASNSASVGCLTNCRPSMKPSFFNRIACGFSNRVNVRPSVLRITTCRSKGPKLAP